MDEAPHTSSPSVARSVAPWLTVLLVLIFALNAIGGWVRLSGSGVAIPQWPIVNGSLLPPASEESWQTVYASFEADQQRLTQRVAKGELSIANLGRAPNGIAEFKHMFLIEWSHRLFAALVGLVTLACITVVMRHPDTRRIAGTPCIAAGVLIILQAVLGGMLITDGTGTHWLFLHQGNAAAILACILIAILRLLNHTRPSIDMMRARQGVRLMALFTVIFIWCELVVGALVAGSRNGGSFRIHGITEGSSLWRYDQTIFWNFIDNADLHQWLHRAVGWVLMIVLLALYTLAWKARHSCGQRARLALMVSATFLPIQIILGLANVEVGFTPFLSLAHQFMGMCLFLSVLLAWHDLCHEPSESPTLPTPSLATVKTTA